MIPIVTSLHRETLYIHIRPCPNKDQRKQAAVLVNGLRVRPSKNRAVVTLPSHLEPLNSFPHRTEFEANIVKAGGSLAFIDYQEPADLTADEQRGCDEHRFRTADEGKHAAA